MRIAATAPLFAWQALEDSSSLRTIRELLAVLPQPEMPISRMPRGR